ncbi:MAG TPA: AAA family ATPase [Candidatus Competibacteraceae bacterium]|nr:AAA family ATPase [Candidatus Competibacteraceae bacterium]
MIIVVGGIKGGSGKTTVATNLAVMCAKERDVLLIDADDQETATDFTILRNATLPEGAGYTSIKLTGPAVRTETQRLTPKYDTIIIDTGGRDTTSQRAALSIATLLLVPFIPRSFDLWTLDKVSTLVEEMRSANPNLAAYVFINRADPRGQDNADTADALKESQGLQFVHAPLGSRKAYSNAAAQGLGVIELRPQDPKATEEISTLYQCVFNVTSTLKAIGVETA